MPNPNITLTRTPSSTTQRFPNLDLNPYWRQGLGSEYVRVLTGNITPGKYKFYKQFCGDGQVDGIKPVNLES